MAISVFDLFKIGIGPSSSHTGGPMAAAHRFARGLDRDGLLDKTARVEAVLYGSLGLTGKGHGSDKAVLLGLSGEKPELVDVDTVDERLAAMRSSGTIRLYRSREIPFVVGEDLVFERKISLPGHPNGMRFTAFDENGETLREKVYYSVGGGFVVDENATGADRIKADDTELPHPFTTAAELLARCRETGLSVSGLMLENEKAFGRTEDEIRARLLDLWRVMSECVRRGIAKEGMLPGGLKVRRRAHQLHRQLQAEDPGSDPLQTMDWVSLFALAVNEENAAGGRIVTAPTNGAAGIIPAVLTYYDRFVRRADGADGRPGGGADDDGVVRFLLTAGAIGVLFKENASISGAEVGCQGEVGSACSMAAAGLTEVLGGTPEQVENAAEIGIEHNLGLTCDPVGGLVQIPCIERNAVASIKAITAARIALRGDGRHFVALDKAIKTMRDTGRDMLDKYKETSRGGLAVNVIEC
ncbi:L-serine ammonia-lyase [Planomonospora parontospora]|uniref:L-serine ammonia-lyase n=1 Tax=Planomonospora parontospora TaxID=58119 RepID=UPI0016717FE8|nr:L-serine ammonia-lyase [Planomonospora parontospora]GGL35493.1 L-serine dehydratase [Planomonospora parontospora subsp. antibiotica]GII17478.1 L-serine dehydratase [Planomonospora parontospora subsp. antibiotica]